MYTSARVTFNRIFMFSFTKNRFVFYTIAFGLLIASLLAPLFLKLNLGIDITGGIQVEYNLPAGDVDTILNPIRQQVIKNTKDRLSEEEKTIITDTLVYGVSGTNNFVIEA